MSNLEIGGTVRVHVRGKDHLAEVVTTTRSRATVRYTDTYGEERVVKLPLGELQAG